jgi:hypothetical protein
MTHALLSAATLPASDVLYFLHPEEVYARGGHDWSLHAFFYSYPAA